MADEEKRLLKRFELNAPALAEPLSSPGDDEIYYLITRDLSGGGAYFHTEAPLTLDTPVQVGIYLDISQLEKLPVAGHVVIRAKGLVKRIEPDGMAVQFLDKCRVLSVT